MKKMFLLFAFLCSVIWTYSQVCSSCNATGWDLSVPQGTTQTYTIPSLSGATYVWVVTGGLVIENGQGTATVTVRVNGQGTLYVTRYKISHNACANKATITAESGSCSILVNYEPCETAHITGCPVSGAAYYEWYVNGVYHGLGNINSNGTHWMEMGFYPSGNPNYYHLRNTNITVCAKAYTAGGSFISQECKTWFAHCLFNLFSDPGTEDAFGAEVRIYPNPAPKSGHLFFDRLPLEKIKAIRLLNREGKVLQVVQQPAEKSIFLDQEQQPEGIYLLQFEIPEGIITRKLLLH